MTKTGPIPVPLHFSAQRKDASRQFAQPQLKARFDRAERSTRVRRDFSMAQATKEGKLDRFALKSRQPCDLAFEKVPDIRARSVGIGSVT